MLGFGVEGFRVLFFLGFGVEGFRGLRVLLVGFRSRG